MVTKKNKIIVRAKEILILLHKEGSVSMWPDCYSLNMHAYELINNIRPNFNGIHILMLIELPDTCLKHLTA